MKTPLMDLSGQSLEVSFALSCFIFNVNRGHNCKKSNNTLSNMLIGLIDDLHQDFKFLMKLMKFSFIKPPNLEQQAGVLAC